MNGVDTRGRTATSSRWSRRHGRPLDVIIVPKVRHARDVWWVDVLLTQLEQTHGITKRIGLEVLIEEAEGLENEIARVSTRLEAIIFGCGDFSASQGARVDTNQHSPPTWRTPAVHARPTEPAAVRCRDRVVRYVISCSASTSGSEMTDARVIATLWVLNVPGGEAEQ